MPEKGIPFAYITAITTTANSARDAIVQKKATPLQRVLGSRTITPRKTHSVIRDIKNATCTILSHTPCDMKEHFCGCGLAGFCLSIFTTYSVVPCSTCLSRVRENPSFW